jgi:hypothetical protein
MAKTGRNELCPCGSGKKYKNCHERKASSRTSQVLMVVVGAAVIAAIAAGVLSFTGERERGAVRVWSAEHGHYHDANGVQVP